MLNYHHRCSVAFPRKQFHKKWLIPNMYFEILFLKLLPPISNANVLKVTKESKEVTIALHVATRSHNPEQSGLMFILRKPYCTSLEYHMDGRFSPAQMWRFIRVIFCKFEDFGKCNTKGSMCCLVNQKKNKLSETWNRNFETFYL